MAKYLRILKLAFVGHFIGMLINVTKRVNNVKIYH